MVKYNYMAAGIITLVVFISGMIVQYELDQARTGDMESRVTDMEITTNSLLVEKEIIDMFSQDRCEIYSARTQEISGRISEIGATLEAYEQNSIFEEAKYQELKHQYTLLQLFYWSKLVDIKKECAGNEFVNVLYFYDDQCEQDCRNQGFILTEIKKIYGDKTMIFSMDADIAEVEPTMLIVLKEFGIDSFPALVIEGELYQGFVAKSALEAIINEKLTE